MSNNASHSTNDLLRRYINGEIGPQEEAQLEKLAQQDEALAEALLGIRQNAETDHEAALQRIKKQLPRRQRRQLYYRLSAAAGLLLIIATVGLIWPSLQESKSMTSESAPMADQTLPNIEETYEDSGAITPKEATSEDEEITKPVPTKPITSTPKTNTQTNEVAREVEAVPDLKEEVSNIEQEIIETAAVTHPAEEAIAEPPAITTRPDPAAATRKRDAQGATANRATDMMANRIAFEDDANIVSGYILDEQDQPIQNANILLPGQPIGEQTDTAGFFQLQTATPVNQFEVDHPNYANVTINLPRGEREVMISMENLTPVSPQDTDDWELNAAKTTIHPNQSKTAAAPEGGMKALRAAMLAKKPAHLPKGKVKISFTVQADGNLTDFEIGRNSTAELIDYVQQYLQQHSNWVLSGGETPARMSLTFRI